MIAAISNLLKFKNDPAAFLRRQALKGDIVSFRLGPASVVLFNHPRLVREMMVGKQKALDKGPLVKELGKLTLGTSVFTAEREDHRKSRRLIQPVFHPHRLEVYAQCMLRAANRLSDSLKSGDEVNMSAAVERVTIEAVGTSLFGASLARNSKEIFAAIRGVLEMPIPIYPNVLRVLSYRLFPTRQKQANRRLDKLIYRMIAERRAAEYPSDDLLTMLIQAQEDDVGRFTDQQVRNETFTLLVAGHETTALALGWSIHVLCEHPELQEELGAEAHHLTEFGWDSLAALPKQSQFLNELLRVYPSGWLMERNATEAVEIGGLAIKPGTVILASQYLIHHDPRFWDEPEVFRMDRWDSPTARKKRTEDFTYFPFGAGARTCIGEHFARAEIILVLATLLKKWRFQLVRPVAIKPTITLHPSEPIRVVVRQTGTA
ncbi:MAG TPA: cytochrome P450 [Opitutus sp.]|nr:cytochrome P450 [Opitutus sp.]